ncbi:TPA: steroid 5-alpha reductase [Candidatus Saccharibacteria bacterium]|nr:steroid 5-alpha reductase [Candidatus Saccharibacteria bacterium]HRK41279.1 DUF1295 domain-containing protein [Candidatus Saccharibacteria bacterium]
MAIAAIVVFFILWAFSAVATLVRGGIFSWVFTDFVLCGVVAAAFMSLVFLYAERIKRYDLVDAAWGMTFIVVALFSFFMQRGSVLDFDLQLIVTTLVVLWGGRLTWHILRRIQDSKTEDARYVELRKRWKGNVRFNTYTRIYLVQALLALFISVPVIHINLFAGGNISAFAWLGVLVWVIGFCFEVVGDQQLGSFVSQPENKGKLMTGGLWKYSRHPNYFGELTQWWGIFIICLTIPYGLVGIIGPVLISYLILFVSGVSLSEKRFEGRTGWDAYRKRTSALIPLPPRKP